MNGNRKDQGRLYPIGLQELDRLLSQNPSLIARSLLNPKSGYAILLSNNEIEPRKMDIVIKVLELAVSSRTDEEAVRDLLMITFKASIFSQQLSSFVSTLKHAPLNKIKSHLPAVINMIERYVCLIPTEAYTKLMGLNDICSAVVTFVKKQYPSYDVTSLEAKLLSIDSQLSDSCKVIENMKRREYRNMKFEKSDNEDPPDSYRNLSVVPKCNELLDPKIPFLRRIIVKGAYVDSEHYLDVQFRLLKEDFVRPLREGINNYLKSSSGRNNDVRVYTNVKYAETRIENKGLVFYINLNLPRHFDPDRSRRLMFGNILCISCDGFGESMQIAKVINRDSLGDHLLGIQLETNDRNYIKKNKTYVVIESKAYFMSYMHTLNAIQKMNGVPLENIIVKTKEDYERPDYLSRFTCFDFSRCLKKTPILTDTSDVCLLDRFEDWPPKDEVSLDESQYKALRGALTRKLSIIQGPPGTGKTYLGLKITEMLLENKNKWNKSDEIHQKCPILVVCYTNHALDQFLEGISKFTDKIIRVGSRSQNDNLRRFQINAQMHRKNHSRDFSHTILSDFGRISFEVKELKNRISSLYSVIKSLDACVVVSLQTFIDFDIIPRKFLTDVCATTLDYLIWNKKDKNREVELPKSEKIPIFSYDGSKVSIPEEDSVDVKELDREIFDEEQNVRILDDDNFSDNESEDADNEFNSDLWNIRFEFEKDTQLAKIKKLENIISENPHHKNCRQYRNELELSQVEIMTIENGLRIVANENESNKLLAVRNFNSLSVSDRWKLYNIWLQMLKTNVIKSKHNLEYEYMKRSNHLESLKSLEYLSIMKDVDVVGMTTTGAAQHYNILHDLAPSIVIVEEAAEILESHVVTSLSSKCQQLILIGDHQQLQPNPSVYQLAVEYNLNVSLFERLIKNGITYHSLSYQHRMKPCISNLLVPTIYSHLKDHPSVEKHPKIKGIVKDLFFLDHEEPESTENVDENKSAENFFEAQFCIALSRHLVYQGYPPSKITILTPYSGQHRLIKKIQRTELLCDSIRVSILDNFQGEENDIIILSLVRSNDDDRAGFLKSDNRVCVAISRAKHGFYMIGNMRLFAKSSNLWTKLNEKLVVGCNIGRKLELRCGNHPDVIIQVDSGKDFDILSPEGGCKRICSTPMPRCKHTCPRTCHIIDADHSKVDCKLPCPKILCPLKHQCPLLCHQKCEPCKVLVSIKLPCGHTSEIPCGIPDYPCPTIVEKQLPKCNHTAKVKCSEDLLNFDCTKKCDSLLSCGHECKQKCHPNKDPNHTDYDCYEKCDRNPTNCTNNHTCLKKCFEDCGECQHLVSMLLPCGHSQKNVKCGTPVDEVKCSFTVTKTVPGCGHELKVTCSTTVSSSMCKKPCTKLLACGHLCQEKCNVQCSSECNFYIDSQHKCSLNHILKLPCSFVNGSKSTVLPMELQTKGNKACAENCSQVLSCGHKCRGKCNQCFNGRVHAKCEDPCQRTLICGHKCKASCSDICPPCVEPCPISCIHKTCKRKCSLTCSPCKKVCPCYSVSKCSHSSCSKTCNDICMASICDKACDLKLNCGHPCLGMCDLDCPQLCRICNKDQVASLLSAQSTTEDDRLIVLEDCKHVVALDTLAELLTKEDNKVGIKQCPQCQAPIYRNARFKFSINKSFQEIIEAKRISHASKVTFYKKDFAARLKKLEKVWPKQVLFIQGKLGYDRNFKLLKKQRLIDEKEFYLFAIQIEALWQSWEIKSALQSHTSTDAFVVSIYDCLSNALEDLVQTTMALGQNVSNQFKVEVLCELRRLFFLVSILISAEQQNNKDILRQVVEAIEIKLRICDYSFAPEEEMKAISILKDIQGYQIPVIPERSEFKSSFGLNQGHWYKCDSGHTFSVTQSLKQSCKDCDLIRSSF